MSLNFNMKKLTQIIFSIVFLTFPTQVHSTIIYGKIECDPIANCIVYAQKSRSEKTYCSDDKKILKIVKMKCGEYQKWDIETEAPIHFGKNIIKKIITSEKKN